jgi:hypothetical protein
VLTLENRHGQHRAWVTISPLVDPTSRLGVVPKSGCNPTTTISNRSKEVIALPSLGTELDMVVRRGTRQAADSGLAISRVPVTSSLKIMQTMHRTTKANTLSRPTNHIPLLIFCLFTSNAHSTEKANHILQALFLCGLVEQKYSSPFLHGRH